MFNKLPIMLLLVLTSTPTFATRTLTLKNGIKLAPQEFLKAVSFMPVDMSSGKPVPKREPITVDFARNVWAIGIPTAQYDFQLTLKLTKAQEAMVKNYRGQETSLGKKVFSDVVRIFTHTIPAGKDGEMVCLEVSESGLKECGR